jgi:hypothetical protein
MPAVMNLVNWEELPYFGTCPEKGARLQTEQAVSMIQSPKRQWHVSINTHHMYVIRRILSLICTL